MTKMARMRSPVSFRQNDPALNRLLQCTLINVVRTHKVHSQLDIRLIDLQIMFLEHQLRLKIQNPPYGSRHASFAEFLQSLSTSLSAEQRALILSLNRLTEAEYPRKSLPAEMIPVLSTYFHEDEIWQLQQQIYKAYQQSGSPCPHYEFCDYLQDRTLITGTLRGILGRVLHIAARQYYHHPDIPLSLQRCLHALNETKGADKLLVLPTDFPTGLRKEKSEKRALKQTISLATFKTLKASYASILPYLAAMDVIWCYRSLPSHPLPAWADPNVLPGREHRSCHSFMDTPDDVDIAARTVSYARWFREWGIRHGSHKTQNRVLDPATTPEIKTDCPEAVPITQIPHTKTERTPRPVSPTIPLPLLPLPDALVRALQSYQDPNSKKEKNKIDEG